MSKIRTREVKKGYIKTIDHAACMSEHVKNTAVKTRLQAEHDNGNEQNNASSYASNNVENTVLEIALDAGFPNNRSFRAAFRK